MKYAFYPCEEAKDWNKNSEFDFSCRQDAHRGITLQARRNYDFKVFYKIDEFINWIRDFDVDYTNPLQIENPTDCDFVFGRKARPVIHLGITLGYLKELYE